MRTRCTLATSGAHLGNEFMTLSAVKPCWVSQRSDQTTRWGLLTADSATEVRFHVEPDACFLATPSDDPWGLSSTSLPPSNVVITPNKVDQAVTVLIWCFRCPVRFSTGALTLLTSFSWVALQYLQACPGSPSVFYIIPGLLSIYYLTLRFHCRSQWPRSLRHDLSSPAGIVGSNPTRGMDVCVYSLFVLGSGLTTGWSLVQGVLPNVLD
jgi:hypothetical protein